MKKLLGLACACAVLALGGTVWADGDKAAKPDHVAKGLAPYFQIQKDLAADKAEVKGHAEALAAHLAKADGACKGELDAVAKAATALAQVDAKDIAKVRAAFGDLSKAVVALADASEKAGMALAGVTVYNCPMAKPYGTWLQDGGALANPYYGKSMLTCGTKVKSYAAAACASGCDKPCGKGDAKAACTDCAKCCEGAAKPACAADCTKPCCKK